MCSYSFLNCFSCMTTATTERMRSRRNGYILKTDLAKVHNK